MNVIEQIAGHIRMGLNHQALLAQGFDPMDIQSAHTHIAAQSGVAAALNQNQGMSGVSSQGNVAAGVQALNTNIENAVAKHLSGVKIDVYDKYKLWFLMLVGAIVLFVLAWRPWADKDISVKPLTAISTAAVPAAASSSSALATLADADNARLKAELAASKQLLDCLSQNGPCAVKK